VYLPGFSTTFTSDCQTRRCLRELHYGILKINEFDCQLCGGHLGSDFQPGPQSQKSAPEADEVMGHIQSFWGNIYQCCLWEYTPPEARKQLVVTEDLFAQVLDTNVSEVLLEFGRSQETM
jgi:hypothetical protein